MEFYDSTYICVFEVEEFNGTTFKTLPPLIDLENPVRTGSSGTSRLPIFLPCGILWLYLYLCFRGRGIQWWHFQNSTTTSWPRKPSLNRKYWNFEVTHLFHWWNFIILPVFMFSRSRNSIVTLSELYHHRLTSKIQYEPEVLELWGYSSFSTVEFYDITYVYVFEFEEFNSDTFRTIAPTIFLKKSVRTGSTGTLRLPIFLPGGILWFYLYLCFRGRRIQWTHFHIHIIIAWFRKSSSNRKYWNFQGCPYFSNLIFWGQPVVVEFWKCHYWIPRPWKHKYRWYHKIPPGKKMGNLEVPVFPVKPGFSRSTGSRRILNVSPLNSLTSKT